MFVCVCGCVRACVCVYKVHTELIVECDAFHHALQGQGLLRWRLGEQPGTLELVLVLHGRKEERGWSRHTFPTQSTQCVLSFTC